MKLNLNMIERFSALKTTEEKLFWLVAPLASITGLVSSFITQFLYSSTITYVANFLCIIIPIILMFYCGYKDNNVHTCYPLLCTIIGGVYIPFLFVANGGFSSGMPIFCAISAILCSFCYDKIWRYVSFLLTIISNLVTFFLVRDNVVEIVTMKQNAFELDVILSYVIVAVGMFIVVSLVINENSLFNLKEKLLGRYVNSDVQNNIREEVKNKTKDDIGVTKKAAVLFIDISHFTTISEKMPPEIIPKFLNVFLSTAEKRVTENGGIVDKFIGDCAMAYWIDEDNDGKILYKAIKTFFDIRQDIYSQEDMIYSRFRTELNFQAGLSYGSVIIGDIGSENRKDYTVIGDVVNTASRLEGMANGGEIVISENIVEILGTGIETELVNEVCLKGKTIPTKFYKVNKILNHSKKTNKIKEKKNNKYKLYICGCRGTMPVSGIRFSEFGGDTTCYVLKKDKHAVVIDCGTGLKNAKEILADCNKIDVLLTHVHYDHILGLLEPTFPKNAIVKYYGFFDGWNGKDTLEYFSNKPYWPVNLIEGQIIGIDLENKIPLTKDINATFYKSDHLNNGCVLKLEVDDKKLCIFTDCENANLLDDKIALNSDIIICDGAYDEQKDLDKVGWGHGSWQKCVDYAKKLNIKKLIIAHHATDSTDSILQSREKEAKNIFAPTSFARVGDCYEF